MSLHQRIDWTSEVPQEKTVCLLGQYGIQILSIFYVLSYFIVFIFKSISLSKYFVHFSSLF